MLGYLDCTPTWLPELITRRRIIRTEQTSNYISTFHNALNSKKAKYHEIRVYFLTKAFVALSRTATLILKMRWFPDEAI